MRVLINVRPTAEQLRIVSDNRAGVRVIRGAAGSGKTTSAVLRLRALLAAYHQRIIRSGAVRPVRALVLTYNRTLRGYIEHLVEEQSSLPDRSNFRLETLTHGQWIKSLVPSIGQIVDGENQESILSKFSRLIPLDRMFLIDEIDYLLGRFRSSEHENYLDAERTGRGATPRVDRTLRQRIINDVVTPYRAHLAAHKLLDWHLLSELAYKVHCKQYDIIIIDEAQDFSANQLRAVTHHLGDGGSLTFVLDTVQRIYSRGYSWSGDLGLIVRPENTINLGENHRNTKAIARFVSPLLNGIPLDDDGSMPDFSRCHRDGPIPRVLVGRYTKQCDYLIKFLLEEVDLSKESVGILHPLGGGWFDELRRRLRAAGLQFVELSRKTDWPNGPENIGLSTLHSSKGLEFDNVVIIGLNASGLSSGVDDEQDDRLSKDRRLLSVGIGRARSNVIIGYKNGEEPKLMKYLDPQTFNEIVL